MTKPYGSGTVLAWWLAATSVAAPRAWGAEAPAEDVLDIPEVVVRAVRPSSGLLDERGVHANVTVITAEEIRRSDARTIQEALQRVPGLGILENTLGGNRAQQTVQMRGFSGMPVDEVTVLVDGVPANVDEFPYPQSGIASVPLDAVERIEVVPGPGAITARYALGGAINIVTRRGGTSGVATGEVAGGSFNTKRFFGTVGGPLPHGFDYYVSARHETEDGARDFSDARVTHTYNKIGYRRGEETDVAFAYTRSESTLKYPFQITPAELERDRTTSAPPGEAGELLHLFALNGRQDLPWGLSLSANGFLRFRTLDFAAGIRAGGGAEIRSETSSGGGTGQISHKVRRGEVRNRIAVGAEYRRDDTNRRSGGVFGVLPFGFRFANDQSVLQDGLGLFALDTLDLFDRVTITAGVRYDRTLMRFVDHLVPANRRFPQHERATPRAGITYNPIKDFGVYFSFAEGFRPPTDFEILGVGPVQANPGLGPVVSRTFEAGVRGRAGGWLEGSAAAFTTRTRNEIFIAPVTLVGNNVPVTRRRGIELSLRPRYGDVADGFLAYTFTEATFASNFPQTDPRTGLLASVRDGSLIPHVPKHRVTAGINVHPLPGLTLSMSGTYVTRRILESDFLNHEPKLDAYVVLNAGLNYEYRGLTFFVQGNNVLDRRYESLGFFGTLTAPPPPNRYLVPAPGWSVEAGMRYQYELPF